MKLLRTQQLETGMTSRQSDVRSPSPDHAPAAVHGRAPDTRNADDVIEADLEVAVVLDDDQDVVVRHLTLDPAADHTRALATEDADDEADRVRTVEVVQGVRVILAPNIWVPGIVHLRVAASVFLA